MNATGPGAEAEYSRGPRGSDGDRDSTRRGSRRGRRAGLGLGLLGAAALLTAEFTPLLRVRTIAAHPRLVRTVQTGPHHAWALIPIALAAAALAVATWRGGGRPAPGAIALLGLAALGVALIADLPDARATGVVGNPSVGLTDAQAHAAVGLYLETLGAVALLLCAAAGLLLEPRLSAGHRGRVRRSARRAGSAP